MQYSTSTTLQKRLNIKDIVMPVAAPAAAPAAAAGPAAAAPAAAPAAEKTEFTVILEKFDPASKAKVIREIKNLVPGLNLVQAKNFVEGAPKTVKEDVKKDEAEAIKKALEAVGAVVKLE